MTENQSYNKLTFKLGKIGQNTTGEKKNTNNVLTQEAKPVIFTTNQMFF